MNNPMLHRWLAQARADEFRRAAARVQATRPQLPRSTWPGPLHEWVTLRFAFPDDAEALARLAMLDSAAPPAEPVLLAEVGGELRAALSLADGAVVADPFEPSAAVVDLLRARAAQLSGSGRRGGRARRVAGLRARLGLATWR